MREGNGGVLQLLQSGWEAPFRSLLTGMLAAFSVSLPVTGAFYLLVPAVAPAVVTIVAGGVQAVTTFAIAGWLERNRGRH